MGLWLLPNSKKASKMDNENKISAKTRLKYVKGKMLLIFYSHVKQPTIGSRLFAFAKVAYPLRRIDKKIEQAKNWGLKGVKKIC